MTCVEVFDDIHDHAEAYNALGRTSSDCPMPAIKTENWYRWDIAINLAGMAGEELVLGSRSTTAGGSPESDVVRATETASQMVARFALGNRLSIFPHNVDRPVQQIIEGVPHLRADVDVMLAMEYRRAKRLLEAERETVVTVARALKDESRLEGDRLVQLLAGLRAPDVCPEKLLNLTG